MKKLFLAFAILTMSIMAFSQTSVKYDYVRTVSIDTMLISGETVNLDFYGKDFFENTRVQVLADTADGTGTGDVVLTVTTKGSLDYTTWFPLDTVTISTTDHATAASQKIEVYYDYLRYAVVVAGTGDSLDVTLNLLFDINQ